MLLSQLSLCLPAVSVNRASFSENTEQFFQMNRTRSSRAVTTAARVQVAQRQLAAEVRMSTHFLVSFFFFSQEMFHLPAQQFSSQHTLNIAISVTLSVHGIIYEYVKVRGVSLEGLLNSFFGD
jgi:hypothetical protein